MIGSGRVLMAFAQFDFDTASHDTVGGRNPAPLGNHGKPLLLVFTRESSCQEFLGGAGFGPPTVVQDDFAGFPKHQPSSTACLSNVAILRTGQRQNSWTPKQRYGEGGYPVLSP